MSGSVELELAAARQLTERIRRVAQNVAEQVEELRTLVAEAKGSEAHVALGYASWTAYLSDLFGDEPLRLARDVRKELVAELHEQGMSTRAIAPIVGVTQQMVAKDLKVTTRLSPAPDESTFGAMPAWAAAPSPAPSVGVPVIIAKPRPVVGLDGKTYAKPAEAPKPRQRRAITATAKSCSWDVRELEKRLEKLRADDRFRANRDGIRSALLGDLQRLQVAITATVAGLEGDA